MLSLICDHPALSQGESDHSSSAHSGRLRLLRQGALAAAASRTLRTVFPVIPIRVHHAGGGGREGRHGGDRGGLPKALHPDDA